MESFALTIVTPDGEVFRGQAEELIVRTVSGDMGIWDFFELVEFNARDFESEYSTVGGWAIEMLNALPHEGDSFQYKNLYIIVSQMEDLRITRLTVVINPVEEDEEEE